MSRSRTPVPAIALSRTRALDDTDGATRQTVEKMCELIRQSVCQHQPTLSTKEASCSLCGKIWPAYSGDVARLANENDSIFRAAAYARDRFAMGSSDQAALAWGVFWYVKHCVKFRLDEGTMLQVGESHDAYGQQQQDLLISPQVLVQMRNPSEDCDGFTMLTAALLTSLGVQVLIATVATEPDDPSRWSHVFLCAIINGRVKPLDTSHGMAPGWMVPRSRINRWQTWTLDGRPADVSIPSYQGLHAYQTYPGLGLLGLNGRRVMRAPLMLVPKRGRGFGGLGQECSASVPEYDDDGTFLGWDDSGCATPLTTIAPVSCPPGQVDNGGGICIPSTTTGADVSCGSVAQSSMTAQQLYNCGYTQTVGGPITNPQAAVNPCPSGQTWTGTSCSGGGTPNYSALASSIVGAVGQDVKAVIQQPQALLNAQTWANLTSYLPIIGIAVLGVVVITSFAGKK